METKSHRKVRFSKRKPLSPFSQKTFLRATRTLEELRMQMHHATQNEVKTDKPTIFHSRGMALKDYKKLCIYYNRLKNLLCRWYLLVLRKDGNHCISQFKEYFNKLWLLSSFEMENVKPVTFSKPNNYLEDILISITNLKRAHEHIGNMFQDQVTVLKGFNNATNILDSGYLQSSHILLESVSIISGVHHEKLFLIIMFCLSINLHKLYRIEPSNVSVEFLSVVLQTCDSFKELFSNTKSCFISQNFVRDLAKNSKPFHGILSGLAKFQAKVASEKIMQALLITVRSERHKFHESSILDMICITSNSNRRTPDRTSTSDYYSASASEGLFRCGFVVTPSFKEQMTDLFTSVSTQNQSLVLKFICSIKNRAPDVQENNALFSVKENQSYAAHKGWRRLKPNSDVEYEQIEKIYWSVFWNEMTKKFMAVPFDSPKNLHYREHRLGSFLVLGNGYVCALLAVLEAAIGTEDISVELQTSLQKFCFSMVSFLSGVSWDKDMCSALKCATRHRCEAVPLSDGKIGIKVGNAFASAFRSSAVILHTGNISSTDICLSCQALNRMSCCLNSFHRWAVVKHGACLSSWDVSTCILIAYSDILQDSRIADSNNPWKSKMHEEQLLMPQLFTDSLKELLNIFNNIQEMPLVFTNHLQSRIKTMIFDDLAANRTNLIRRFISCQEGSAASFQNAMEVVIEPIYESAKCVLKDNQILVLMDKVLTSAIDAYVDSCGGRTLGMRWTSRDSAADDHRAFLAWVDSLDLSTNVKDSLKALPCIPRLSESGNRIQQYSRWRTWKRRRRRVRPI